MTNEIPTAAVEKPSLWQRIKTGTKNFASHALGYIPRGILLTALVFAVSAVAEATLGFGLGVSGLDTPVLLGKFAAHLAAGCVISGAIGAALPACNPTAQCASGTQASGNPLLSKREEQLGQYLAKTVGDHATDLAQTAAIDAVAPGASLPAHLLTTATKAATTGWSK